MEYFVYILRTGEDGSCTIGHTADLEERIQRLEQGRSSYVKGKASWRVTLPLQVAGGPG